MNLYIGTIMIFSMFLFLISIFTYNSTKNRKFCGYWCFYPCIFSKIGLSFLLISWGSLILSSDDFIYKTRKNIGKIRCYDPSDPMCLDGYVLASNPELFFKFIAASILIIIGLYILSYKDIILTKKQIIIRHNFLFFNREKALNLDEVQTQIKENGAMGLKGKKSNMMISFPYAKQDILKIAELISSPNSSKFLR